MKKPEVFNRRLFMVCRENKFEKRAVLNPALWPEGDDFHCYYRAVAPDMVSTLGYARLTYDGDKATITERWDRPLLAPRYDYDKMGVEDPRIVRFEDKYYLFYTAYDGYNATMAMAVGDTPLSFGEASRIGPLYTNEEAMKLVSGKPDLQVYLDIWAKDPKDQLLWEKDMMIFPRRINGKIACVHRLRPDMQIAYFDTIEQLSDQEYWKEYLQNMDKFRLMKREQPWESSHMGIGPVPLETEYGWLIIFHGANYPGVSSKVKTYRAGAALLDLDDPQKIIGRTKEPLFEPIEKWEKVGDVNEVVFPEGFAVRDNVIDLYYGGADSVIGVISVRLDELLDYLRK